MKEETYSTGEVLNALNEFVKAKVLIKTITKDGEIYYMENPDFYKFSGEEQKKRLNLDF